MHTTRRQLIGIAAFGAAGLAVGPSLHFKPAGATSPKSMPIPGATGERMAVSTASHYRPYRSKPSNNAGVVTWVQIDLGARQRIDGVKLFPVSTLFDAPGDGFPLRFRIECSDDPAFQTPHLMLDWTGADYPDPANQIVRFPANNAAGRYVRLTVTRLRVLKPTPLLPQLSDARQKTLLEAIQGLHAFVLSKMEVLLAGDDLAVLRPVSVDAVLGNPDDAQQLTRSPRPQGEGIVTDNPRNVTAPEAWRPVAYRAQAPLTGVQMRDGLFLTALKNNVDYLLNSFSLDDLLRQFRERAGKPLPASTHQAHVVWEEALAGSNAGRFLMGAGKTLHWLEHAQLRNRMDAVVEGIAQCREPDGYIMAYPRDTLFVSERGAYTRAWVTHGLIEAGYAGNTKAFDLLRGYYDWYNRMPCLPEVLRRCSFGPQGTVANTRVYFTPVGRPVDLQVVQRYLQESYWLEALAARREEALWQYPYERPHSYLLTFMEAYLDLYRATGEQRYLDAVLGGWELFRENWQYPGGAISLIEHHDCPPKANPLHERRGETCGGAFWMLLNQRLHLLHPDEEKYVAEIEKSIYNVLLANQAGSEGIRYHTLLLGQKEAPTCTNTCCEGQATRLIGSLPEFIYSVAEDGLYVNLFESSSIDWQQSGRRMQLRMETRFPYSPQVRLVIQSDKPEQAKIRIRTPSWAVGIMEIRVNGDPVGVGKPGSYVTLERVWSAGDAIVFELPMAFKLTKYTGIDRLERRERFALEYGPILMAVQGSADTQLSLRLAASPQELVDRLRPVESEPLHFTMTHEFSGTKWIPYLEVASESFSCFPFIDSAATLL